MKKADAKKYLTAEQKKELEEYALNLKEELDSTDFSKEEKIECFETLMSYETNLMISERLKDKHNLEVDKMNKINEKYKKEEDPVKAQKYIEQYNKAKERKNKFKEEYNHFETLRASQEPVAKEQHSKLQKALKKENVKEKAPKVEKTNKQAR